MAVLTVGVPIPAPLTPSFEESEASQNIWPPMKTHESGYAGRGTRRCRARLLRLQPGMARTLTALGYIERSPLSHVFPTEGHRYEPLRPVDQNAPRPLGDGSSHVWGTAGNGPAGDGSFWDTASEATAMRAKFDYDTGPVDGDPAAWIEVQRWPRSIPHLGGGAGPPHADRLARWRLGTYCGRGRAAARIKVRGLNGPWTTQGSD